MCGGGDSGVGYGRRVTVRMEQDRWRRVSLGLALNELWLAGWQRGNSKRGSAVCRTRVPAGGCAGRSLFGGGFDFRGFMYCERLLYAI